MVLSRRERNVVIGTLIAVAALVLDRFALTPILDSWSALEAQKEQLISKVKRGESVIKQEPEAEATWKRRVTEGLKQTGDETEDAMLHAVQAWSQDSRLTLVSVGAERALRQGRTPEVVVQVAGVGPMSAVARFLWDVQSTRLPLKVVGMELYSRKEGTDDLSLTLHLSGLYMPADWKIATAARTAPAPGGSRP